MMGLQVTQLMQGDEMSNPSNPVIVRLPKAEHRQARIMAASQGKTLMEYLASLVREDAASPKTERAA